MTPEAGPEKILEQLKQAYDLLRQHHLTHEEILRYLIPSPGEITIPSTAFSERLSSLETLTKYLKENHRLPLKEIAQKLNRSYRTIWGAYRAAQQKNPEPLAPAPTLYSIPTTTFSPRQLSVLETLTHYLRSQYHLRYSEIARLLHRDPRTIWTTEHHAQTKLRT